MSKPVPALCAFVVAALCLGGAVLAQQRDTDPAPDELQRLAEQLRGGTTFERREASHRLRELGALAAPVVPDLIVALDDEEQQVWFNSIMALAEIGPAAAPAVPKLIRDLDQPRRRRRGRYGEQVWYRTAFALSRMGPEALAGLLTALNSESSDVRSGAARAIGWMRAEDSKVIAALVRLLDDREQKVRAVASEALSEIGPKTVSRLVEALASESSAAQIGAVRALGAMKQRANQAVDPVALLFHDARTAEARAEALAALVRISKSTNSDALLPLLFEGLRDSNEQVVRSAASGLLRMRPLARVIVPVLIDMLGSGTEEIQSRAADLLGRFGDRADAAVPALIGVAGLDAGAAEVARQALVRIGPPSVPSLLEAAAGFSLDSIRDDHWTVRVLNELRGGALPELTKTVEGNAATSAKLAAVLALAGMGDEAQPAIPALFGALKDPVPRVRAAALDALVRTGAQSEQLLPHVKRMLADPATEPRVSAGRAARSMGAGASLLLEDLIGALDSNDAALQITAAHALGSLGSSAARALPRLTELLSAESPAVRIAVIRCLGAIGPEANRCAGQIIGLGRSEHAEERAAVVFALQEFAISDEETSKLLGDLRGDPVSEVRAAAIQASVRLDADDPGHARMLAEAMRHESAEVRQAAARLVPDLAGNRGIAVDGLFDLLDSDESADRDLAVDLLRQLQPDTVPRWILALENKTPAVRLFACEQLGRIGEEARAAVPALRRCLGDDYDFVRRQAGDALRRIE